MRRRHTHLLTLALVGVSLAALLSGIAQHQAAAQSDNLLINPGFEAPFTNQGGDPPRQVANGWVAWHIQRADDEPDFQNTQPEYSETVRADRVRSGDNAQRYESFFATHTGGVFQVVPNVAVGSEVTFNVYVWVWSSGLSDEDVSQDDGDVIVDIGIDPTGGTDGSSADIVWSVGEEKYDAYNQYATSAIAESDTISVWVRSRVGFPVQSSRIYVDDAELLVENPVIVTEEPTEEVTEAPTVPTSTPVPSPTPDEVNPDPVTPVTPTTPAPTATTAPISDTLPGRVSHTVQRGDTVSALARRYSSSVDAITRANGLNDSALIFVGQTLLIPVPQQAAPTPTFFVIVTATPGAAVPTPIPGVYIVQPGDTLSSIGRQFNTTVAAIAQLNGIVNPNRIFSGQQLVITPTGAPTVTPRPTVIANTPIPVPTAVPTPTLYVVQPGDNLFRIALRFNVSLSDLIRANGIVNANRIFTGQQIVIP